METSRWIALSLLLLLTLNLAAQTAQAPTPPAQAAREDGLYATFKTTQGDITVKLYEKESPITVRNFVSLAQGRKAWKDPKSGQMVRKPLYNGLTFHRVIPGFMIQGGDPQGDGAGDVGFVIPDEFHPSLKFDQPGRLAMANAGPKTGSCQFFITEVPTPHLNGAHTIFGQVIQGQDVVTKIANVPRGANDKPRTPVRITSVVIERVGAAPVPPPAAKKAAPRKAVPKKK
ncbi:MAG TPA: peptidylprolyl isomerase [Bryobacteraceae bacterium]|nr:peptidylprolyl isomerase [Bryobacteraceae bacterium]